MKFHNVELNIVELHNRLFKNQTVPSDWRGPPSFERSIPAFSKFASEFEVPAHLEASQL